MATACYTANYLPASFRGVPFTAETVSSDHGRRVAEGEFPFGETTQLADLGIKIRRYQLNGRMQENSHVLDAAAMIAACQTPGPGLLIHPTRGAIMVICSRCGVSDDIETGQGVTNLDLEFIESEFTGGNGFSLTAALGIISLVAITAATRANISRNYDPAGVRYYQVPQVIESARGAIQKTLDQYNASTATTQSQTTWRMVSSFNAAINDDTVIIDPDKYGTLLANGMATLDAATNGQGKAAAFRALANWAAKASALNGEARASENTIFSSTRVLAAAHMVRGFLEKDATTLDAALTDYDTVSVILQEEATIANTECNDPLYFLAIKDFLIEAQTILLQRAYTLPGMVTYRFKGGTHSLVAAYEIYGDARRARDLETRNPQYAPFAFGPEILASEVANA